MFFVVVVVVVWLYVLVGCRWLYASAVPKTRNRLCGFYFHFLLNSVNFLTQQQKKAVLTFIIYNIFFAAGQNKNVIGHCILVRVAIFSSWKPDLRIARFRLASLSMQCVCACGRSLVWMDSCRGECDVKVCHVPTMYAYTNEIKFIYRWYHQTRMHRAHIIIFQQTNEDDACINCVILCHLIVGPGFALGEWCRRHFV